MGKSETRDLSPRLKIDLHLGAGELTVNGGSEDWANGSFEYSTAKMKPEFNYDLKGNTGNLSIDQPSTKKITNFTNYQNEWNVELSNNIPIDLNIDSGATGTELNLAGLQLASLTISTGVGKTLIDLSGDWKNSFDAKISNGVGDTEIIVPKNVGVKIKVDKGIGGTDISGLISQGDGVYINEAYENAPVKIDIDLDFGVGGLEVTVEN
ncbi:toast rack family protein [Bacillus sp. DJP31]|uniref:toast rack family protein n=1 Tax=Bacillus sp. DJP31 TaxID=3409789 RepID=UPI003BB76C7F